jgi:hypothetical protein
MQGLGARPICGALIIQQLIHHLDTKSFNAFLGVFLQPWCLGGGAFPSD